MSRITDSMKNAWHQNKDNVKSFISKPSSNVDKAQLINENEEEEEVTDQLDYEGWKKRQLSVDPLGPSHPLRLKFLQKADQCICCSMKKRWQIAILANLGFIIAFGIRCNFGAARLRMRNNYTDPVTGKVEIAQFHWSAGTLGVVEGSFFYGYLITQLPGGFLAAKFPANKLFGIAIGATSLLNMLIPVACNGGPAGVIFIQILQGLVQGVTYPACHGIWRFWAPPLERSKLATTAFTGSYAGAVIGMPVSALLTSYAGWQSSFYVYGVMGVIWCIFWLLFTYEKPAYHPTITEEESIYIQTAIGPVSQLQMKVNNVPWKEIFTSRPVWAIMVANFARSWTFYLLLNHQLAYFQEVLGIPMREGGWLAAIPHAIMAIIVLIGGQLADRLRSREILSTTMVRKVMNCGGFGGEAIFLLVVAFTRNPGGAIFALCLAVGSSGFAISGYQVNHLDIAPRYASLLMGISNGVGTFSGMICPAITESLRATGTDLVAKAKAWETIFLIASMIHFTGVTFYAIFASGEKQPWAEPPEENDEFKPDDFAQKAVQSGKLAGYGAANEYSILPNGNQTGNNLMEGSMSGPTMESQNNAPGNYDLNSAWNDTPAGGGGYGAAGENYQGY